MGNIKANLLEVVSSILPVTVFVTILQIILKLPITVFLQFFVGLIMVATGLFLFQLGVNLGLIQIGNEIGASLPKLGKVWILILFGFLTGFAVTVAEPDVRVLSTQVDIVSSGIIPKNLLISVVALGVAFFIGLGMLHVIFRIPLKLILSISYIIIFVLAIFTPTEFAAVALDSGGVTTGPMTTPFLIALGVGVAAVVGERKHSGDGFGFVALGSVGPILAVMILGVIYG